MHYTKFLELFQIAKVKKEALNFKENLFFQKKTI